jgi:hypothetical protein
MGARRKMAMTEEHFKKLIENNLDYAELLLVPEETGLELINKDAGLGNTTYKQQALLMNWFNSLHIIQQFTKPIQIPVKIVLDEDNNQQQIPINLQEYTRKELEEQIGNGTIKIITQQVPRYPKAYQSLRSKISAMNLTSGSIEGFRALLQHSTIHKTKQEQTLEDLTPIKKQKRGKRNNDIPN